MKIYQLSQFSNHDVLSLGPTPTGESCAQVGSDDYRKWSRIELGVFISQLKRTFQDIPPNIHLHITSNQHDFGTYHEVGVKFPYNDEAATQYAFHMENNTPEYWDELSKKELEAQEYPYMNDREDDHEDNLSDMDADSMTLRDAGWGTDEDYGSASDVL